MFEKKTFPTIKTFARFLPCLTTSLLCAVIFSTNAFALVNNTFYVSQTSGNNQNNGSLTSPFASIQKCANIAVSGDVCLIRAGVYRETVKPANSGVTFKRYGTEKVIISGTEVLANSGFSPYKGNIYKSSLSWSLNVREPYIQSTNNQVFVDGKMLVEARWPNIAAKEVTNITNIAGKRQNNARADSASISNATNAQYYDTDLANAGSFWGTGVNKGKINFAPGFSIMTTSCDIASKNNGAVAFQCNADPGQGNVGRSFDATSGSMLAPKANNYYYLWGKLEALDAAGEFFVDPLTNGTVVNNKGNYWNNGSYTVYLQMPDNSNPITSAKVIEVRKRMYGFDLTGKTNTTLDGIAFFAATINTDNNSNNNLLKNLEMRYLWHTQELPPFFYGDGTLGLAIRGSNNVLKNSYLAYTSGTMLSFRAGHQKTNVGNTAINNVIHDVGYGGIGTGYEGSSADALHKHQLKQNTFFNAGRYLIQAESATDVTYNDVYNSHLQITDLGAIYGWGVDGKGANIAYNTVHDVWAEKRDNDTQFGGHGIYLDDESTDFNIYRNIVWNTTSPGLMLATYRPTSQDFNPGKTSNNRTAYNNTIDGTLGLLNKCEGGQCGFQTGTQIKNNIFTGLLAQPALDAQHGTIDWANNWYGNALFSNKDAADYSLRDGSPALNSGLSLPPYTDGSVGNPDRGALERGKPPFIAGALIAQKDLAALKLACQKQGSSATCLISGLPVGRKIPSNFQLKIGAAVAGGSCVNQTNYATQISTATCSNIDLGGQSNLQTVFVSIGTAALVKKGAANFDGVLRISQVSPSAGTVAAGGKITISGQQFFTLANSGFARVINLKNSSGQRLYDYQVPVVINTQSLISNGKMRSDCGDIRFTDSFQNLDYWLEAGCNTTKTRLWVKTSYIPNDNSGIIYLSYGTTSLVSASNGRKTFIWFEDFSGSLSPAISLGSNPVGISVAVANGEMKISGTNNSTNQYSLWGFGLYQDQIAFPENFALDSELRVLQGTNFLANVGSFDSTMTLFGTPSGSPVGKDIAYYDNGWKNAGKSTVSGVAIMPKTKFSFAVLGQKTARTVQWRENGNTQTVLATRTNLNNPLYGYFTFRPGQIESFDARFDNLRVRNVAAIEPLAVVSDLEAQKNPLQILVNNVACNNVQFISPYQLSCNVGQAVLLQSVTVINPDGTSSSFNF